MGVEGAGVAGNCQAHNLKVTVHVQQRVSLSKIMSAHSDDAGQKEWA
jgi:hypothetical protein